LLLGFLFVALSNILLISQGDVIKRATNLLTTAISEQDFSHQSEFLRLAGLLLLMVLGAGLFMFLKRQFIIVVSRLIEADMKNEIYNHYQKLDLSFYKKNNTGDLMNRISEDVGKVRMYVGPAIMYIVDTFFTVITVMYFMLNENVLLTLIVLIPLPFLSLIIFKVSNRINKRSTKVQEELSELTANAQESFSGIRIIKAFNRESFFESVFTKKSNDYKKAALNLARSEAAFQPFVVGMVGISLLSIIYVGGKLYIDGTITMGNLPQFVFFVYKLTWPFAALGWVSSLVQRAAASQTRINEFLQTEPEIKNNTQESKKLDGKIKFSNVSFSYPDTGVEALKNISFTLNKGETLAVIGPTGSGKSTLANLIMRMHDVKSGVIEVDDVPIEKHNLFSLRNQMGYVPQEVFLFSDSITNNIGFSMNEGEKNKTVRIEQAAKDAVVYQNILEFPDKFETIVGERGITLSGGQKQRVSIARALIKEPAVLLFDDCLSAVDTETEDEILTNLNRIMNGKTAVIISHRISTVKNADKIIYLKNGEIAEMGTHLELIAKQGEYHQLYEMQLLK
jgi:ATP-binding cassette subfamily B protein